MTGMERSRIKTSASAGELELRTKFYQYFELVPATSEALKREVYKLRFQVYCVETGFERREDCEVFNDSGRKVFLEKDIYDRRSDHYLVRHRRTGLYAATVRLVLPDADDVLEPYPIESHCRLEKPVTDRKIRPHLAEISRLAVSKEFKKRPGEAGTLAGIGPQPAVYFEADERRILPHMTVGLFAAIVRMTRDRDISHWYAVMEPALLRLLRLFGIRFAPIGPDADYHGVRRPCLAEVDRVLPMIRKVNPAVWDLITEGGKYA
ncbi:MAG: PEP-CTERM/exosortase system-associated acyltransferase [Methylohalobius sp. ZOD2]|nr:PEP-CTERM/exosortase system-associated acyltransferase [Methylothermaceae bacterium]